MKRNGKKRTTIRDVAQLAGVSTAVVSYVLNDTPGKSLPEETRARVRNAAQALKYVPNNAARSMRRERSMMLGVVTFWETDNTFFTEVLRGIVDKANEQGYSICIWSNSKRAASLEYVRSFLQNQVDGMIMIAPLEAAEGYCEEAHLKKIRQSGIPCVMVNGSGCEQGVHTIHVDLTEAGYCATDHLIKKGHRRIAFAQSEDCGRWLTEARQQGYLQCLRDHGILQKEAVICQPEEIRRLVEQIKQKKSDVTAIVANKSDAGHLVLKAAHEQGVKVPEELSVVAANTHAYTAFLFPALTAVALPTLEIGAAAVETLVRFTGENNGQYLHLSLSCSICERDSVQPCPKQ